jgi:hypothetical protein
MVTIDTRLFPEDSKLRVRAHIKSNKLGVATTIQVFIGDKPFRPAPNTKYIVEPHIKKVFNQNRLATI